MENKVVFLGADVCKLSADCRLRVLMIHSLKADVIDIVGLGNHFINHLAEL
jgi:hypothetical protein